MLKKISREEAKDLMKSERYQDMLKAYESKALEFNFAPSPSLVEEMKIKFFIEFYSNTYLRKYPDRVYTEETVSSSVVSAPKVSSDTISNDPGKDLAITDIGKTSVAELLKEDTNLSESTDLISSNNVNFAELPKNSDEIPAIIPTNSGSVDDTEQSDNKDQYSSNLDEELSVTDEYLSVTKDATYSSINNSEAFSYSVNDTEQFGNEGQDSPDINKEENPDEKASVTPSSTNDEYVVKCPAVDTKSPFASLVGVFTSVWHSFGKMFHSKTKPTGDAVFDSLPGKSSFFGDNLNDDVDTIGGISEVNNNLFDQD